jgi:hypothetical protein
MHGDYFGTERSEKFKKITFVTALAFISLMIIQIGNYYIVKPYFSSTQYLTDEVSW